jgi:hypothetical protein
MSGTARNAAETSELTDESSEKSGIRNAALLGSTRLRFERGSSVCVITVEAPVRNDLIPELYRLLLSAGVQVMRVHAQVLGDRTLHELDIAFVDGTPLDDERWRNVQAVTIDYLGDRVAPHGPELRFTRSRPPAQRTVGK